MGLVYFEDIKVGDSWTSSGLVIDREEMLAYNRANDPWPMHVDAEAAAQTPFGGLIASGGYTISIMYRNMDAPGSDMGVPGWPRMELEVP